MSWLLPLVSQKRVTKRLKKYYPKDFQDTTWTVAVQWNHSKYEVKTTKVSREPSRGPSQLLLQFLRFGADRSLAVSVLVCTTIFVV